MAFKPPKKPVQFAHLKQTLANANPDNPMYQTIQAIIEKLIQFQNQNIDDKSKIIADVTKIGGAITGGGGGGSTGSGLANLTYLTKDDETSTVSNSIQLLAGTGITFDDSAANKRIINTSGSSSDHYDAPLTDGDIDETHLIFAMGECIIVQIPV